MSDIRFGLIGYGRWGRNHARAILATDQAQLVAISEKSADARALVRSDHAHVTVFEDYRELVCRDDIDVVDVVLPTYLHFEAGKAALEAGKHLFVEKPMATTVAQCRELNQLAESKGKVVVVGFKRRVSVLWSRVKQMIDEGAIGEPQYAVFELWRQPYRLGSDGWRYDIERVGSWILEEPVHFFDKARWYFANVGEPISVYAAASSRQPGHSELHDNVNILVKFPGGAHAVITQTLSAFGHHQGVKVTGTQGAIWARWHGAGDVDSAPKTTLQHVDRDGNVQDVPLPVENQEQELATEIGAVVRAARGEATPAASGLDGVWSVALCHAAQESVKRGVPVSVDGFQP